MPPSDDVARRLTDWIAKARGGTVYTRFLDPAAADIARRECRRAGMAIDFYGGYDGAERCIAAISPFGEQPPPPDAYPIAALEVTWDARYGDVGHRDLLGAILGLGLSRDILGDIRVSQGRALIYVLRDMRAAIEGLSQAGRTTVRVAEASDAGDIEATHGGEEITATVATLRLDAVLAAGLKLGRERAQELIRAGLVKRNHDIEMKPDRAVCEGDVLSVRGHGRLQVVAIGGESRKGRRFVQLKRS